MTLITVYGHVKCQRRHVLSCLHWASDPPQVLWVLICVCVCVRGHNIVYISCQQIKRQINKAAKNRDQWKIRQKAWSVVKVEIVTILFSFKNFCFIYSPLNRKVLKNYSKSFCLFQVSRNMHLKGIHHSKMFYIWLSFRHPFKSKFS